MGGSHGEPAGRYRCPVILTYQFRLLPSKAQHRALESILEWQRLLYNAALEERIGAHRRGVDLSYMDQTKGLTELRRTDAEAGAMPVHLQRGTLKRLDNAFKAFFRRLTERKGKSGFPRFRGKGRWRSFGFSEGLGFSFDGRSVRFKGMPGALKVHLHRPLPTDGQVRSCTIRRDSKGWKIGFAIRLADSPLRRSQRYVGVDLGIATFAALSDGGFIPSLRAARRAQRRLRVAHRAFTRKLPASRNRAKAKVELGRCHAAVARSRSDYLHQASARLLRDYDVIAIESLNVRSLARSALAGDVHDASWARFISFLAYKAVKAGARLVEVDPRDSSQDCSGCGTKVPKTLRERWHNCPCCGCSVDRDLNAARNILIRAGVRPGLRNVADLGMRAGGNLRIFD